MKSNNHMLGLFWTWDIQTKNNAIKRVGSWWFPSVDWGQESIFLGIDVLNGRILGLGCGYYWNRYQKDKLRHGVACAKFDFFWTMVFWWCMADSLGEYESRVDIIWRASWISVEVDEITGWLLYLSPIAIFALGFHSILCPFGGTPVYRISDPQHHDSLNKSL